MNEATLVSQNKAAAIFSVRPHTIGDLVRCRGLTPKPMSNGMAHGLDMDDLGVIAEALDMPEALAGVTAAA